MAKKINKKITFQEDSIWQCIKQLRDQIPQSASLGSNPGFSTSWCYDLELFNVSGLQFSHL